MNKGWIAVVGVVGLIIGLAISPLFRASYNLKPLTNKDSGRYGMMDWGMMSRSMTDYMGSPEGRQRMAEIMSDQQMRDSMIDIMSTQEMRESMVDMMRDSKMQEAMADIMQEPETRDAMVQIMSSPKMKEAMINILSSPAMKDVLKQAARNQKIIPLISRIIDQNINYSSPYDTPK